VKIIKNTGVSAWLKSATQKMYRIYDIHLFVTPFLRIKIPRSMTGKYGITSCFKNDIEYKIENRMKTLDRIELLTKTDKKSNKEKIQKYRLVNRSKLGKINENSTTNIRKKLYTTNSPLN
jgi:hypothetical protein